MYSKSLCFIQPTYCLTTVVVNQWIVLSWMTDQLVDLIISPLNKCGRKWSHIVFRCLLQMFGVKNAKVTAEVQLETTTSGGCDSVGDDSLKAAEISNRHRGYVLSFKQLVWFISFGRFALSKIMRGWGFNASSTSGCDLQMDVPIHCANNSPPNTHAPCLYWALLWCLLFHTDSGVVVAAAQCADSNWHGTCPRSSLPCKLLFPQRRLLHTSSSDYSAYFPFFC